MKRVIFPPDKIIAADDCNERALIAKDSDGNVGIIVKQLTSGSPRYYIAWSDGRQSNSHNNLLSLWDNTGAGIKFFQV